MLIMSMQLFAQDTIASRKWTSVKGQSITATAHGLAGNKVILEKTNGKIIKVPLNMLVEADRKLLVKHFNTKADAENEADDPDEAEEEKNDDKEENGRKNFSNNFKEQEESIYSSQIKQQLVSLIKTKYKLKKS